MVDFIRISQNELNSLFFKILIKHGVKEKEAEAVARIFTSNAADGVLSHSVNRFPLMIKYLDEKIIIPDNVPKKVSSYGVLEKWNAGRCFGVLSAEYAMTRAIEIASENGAGIVTMTNSNHWMRAGYYGWMAAEKGFIGICWTTTGKNLVPWGGTEIAIGNNPLVIAVPRKKGPIVFDSSMAQYSWGKIDEYISAGEKLPSIGGYDSNGNKTDDPSAIRETFKALPAGFWKGSGLSILLEAVACSLGNSPTVSEMPVSSIVETNMTQVFIALNNKMLNGMDNDNIADKIIDALHSSESEKPDSPIRYPGERIMQTRKDSKEKGIKVPIRSLENLKSML